MYLYPYQDLYTGLYLAHSCTADIKHSFFGIRTSGGFLAGQALEATRSFLHSEAAPERDWNLLDRKCT